MLLLKNYTNLWCALSNSLSRRSKSWAKNSHKLFFHCPGELRLGGFLPNSPEHSWHQSCFLWDVTEPKLSIPPQICHFTQTGSGTFTRGTFNRTQPLPGITKPNYPSSSGFWSSSFDIPQRRAWRNSASGFTQALPASEKVSWQFLQHPRACKPGLSLLLSCCVLFKPHLDMANARRKSLVWQGEKLLFSP